MFKFLPDYTVYIPEDSIPHIQLSENVKSHNKFSFDIC